nr:hypothetical protein [Tanacetum cinerariifolium]
CETAQEIWLRVQQMMKGSDIGIQEKKAKLFNEWERQMQMVGGNGENQFRQYAGQNVGNLNSRKLLSNTNLIKELSKSFVFKLRTIISSNTLDLKLKIHLGNGNQNQIGNGNLVATRAKGNAAGQNGNQIRCYNCKGKEEAGIQLQAEEYDLMAAAADLDEIEELDANCILMANLQKALTSDTQTDSAPVYDSDGSVEVHENCNDNEIFNMFTQEEQYTELLKPIPESHQVPQNDNNVIFVDTNMEQGGETVEQHLTNFEETRALYESLYQNLATEVEKVNSVNRKLKETNADMTTELARYKNQERCFEISQEKYDKLERMTIEKHNWASSAHQELHKIVKEENFPIVNQVDARVQNVEIQFLKEAAKFVGDFKSLVNEVDESLAKHKALELEIEHLQTVLERMKERFENCIIKKETEYAKLWNDWYKKCNECKYDKISYDKAYKDMKQKIEWLQAQLEDLKGKCKDTSCVSNTLNPLSQKLENENVELEFQVYVNDIIFGSTKPRMESCDPIGTPIEIKDKLDLDQNGTPFDATKYRSMIGDLMYLTSSRPDIVHATCLCEDSSFELTEFLDANYAGCKDTFKSTSGGA